MRLGRFAAAAGMCLGLTLTAGSCGGHNRHARTAMGTLSIYTSLPFEGPYAADAGAVYNGEQLALAQAGSVVNGSKVVLRRLDDATSVTGSIPTLVGQSARTAVGDQSTIAYIGELTPGSSPPSIRILSQAGVLQVSPGDSAAALEGTFARVLPRDFDEADAQLAALRKLRVSRVYLLGDRTTYGRDVAAAVLRDAPSNGLTVVDPAGKYLPADTRALVRAIKKSKAGALLYAGLPSPPVATFWNALTAADGTIRKIAPAAITSSPTWTQTTASARSNTYLSAPGLFRGLPRAGQQFQTDFLATYGSHARWTSGIFGYVAMSGVLAALHSLGARVKNPRAKVAEAFLHVRNLPSALGAYSIVGGQTSFRAHFFTTYRRYGATPTYDPTLG